MRPTTLHVGGTLYWVLRTYTPGTGFLVDADSTPSIAVRKNGASVGDSVTVTKRSATTGIYDCSYNPAGEVEGDKFTIEESCVISSVTYTQNWECVVNAVERGTDSALTDKTGYSLANGSIVAATFAADSITASALAADAVTEIADAILSRNVSNVEGSAGEHTLCTIILATLESSVSGTTWTIKRTNGSTTHATKTVTVNSGADPITGVS